MIYWAPFLHFYQPPTQFHAILKKVCRESYRPLVKMLLEHPNAKVTINISGVLTETLNDHGAEDVLEGIRQLAKNGQLEFVDSAKYHAILPLIPQKEMRRQIDLNHKTNLYFFKDIYKPKGFFPPEMCFSTELVKLLCAMKYEWVLISGVACLEKWPLDVIYKISIGKSDINVFYRDDILSNKISFHNIDSDDFIQELVNLSKAREDIYVITAMDAETFGHHIQNWERIFLAKVYEKIEAAEAYFDSIKQKSDLADMHKKIFESKGMALIKVVTMSELLKKFPSKRSKMPKPSSWSSSEKDIQNKDYYPLWKGLDNKIHQMQWEHINICFELVDEVCGVKDNKKESVRFAMIARGLMDRAIHSCQMWWANKELGMWDINLINKGLSLQEEALLNAYKAIKISDMDEETKKQFYHKVIAARDIANKIRDRLLE